MLLTNISNVLESVQVSLMDAELITQSEVSQKEKNKDCVLILMYVV